uniref:Uncharacterized protein n=1 Tax=Drosophila-associated filamentous virus TaxID=2743186 RepID=A0A6M9TZZ9_9VIRU|nr:putative protein 63 [Drosophila-associated filamentous virus]
MVVFSLVVVGYKMFIPANNTLATSSFSRQIIKLKFCISCSRTEPSSRVVQFNTCRHCWCFDCFFNLLLQSSLNRENEHLYCSHHHCNNNNSVDYVKYIKILNNNTIQELYLPFDIDKEIVDGRIIRYCSI